MKGDGELGMGDSCSFRWLPVVWVCTDIFWILLILIISA